MNAAKRGEVWLVDLGQPKEDHEQAGRRLAVIFQTDDLSPFEHYCNHPFNHTVQASRFCEHRLDSSQRGWPGSRDSVALCHQIRALDRRKLLHKIGELAPERLSEIELAVLFVLGIPP
jgi:mRNA interferase MazF